MNLSGLSREEVCLMWGVEDKDLDAFVKERIVPGTSIAILPPVILSPIPGKYRVLSSVEGVEDTIVEVTLPQQWIRV